MIVRLKEVFRKICFTKSFAGIFTYSYIIYAAYYVFVTLTFLYIFYMLLYYYVYLMMQVFILYNVNKYK